MSDERDSPVGVTHHPRPANAGQTDTIGDDISRFVYVTYIHATADAVWYACTSPECTKRYWFGYHLATDWKPGSAWNLIRPDGGIVVSGQILEIERVRHVALTWRDEQRPELGAEGFSRCTFDLEAFDSATKLTVSHAIDVAESKLIALVSNSWPQVFLNLKSLLETGDVMLRHSLRSPSAEGRA